MLPFFVAFAAPIVSLAVNETSTRPFGPSFAEAHGIGIRATTLSIDWSQAEPKPGEFDLTWPRAAESFYPGQGWAVGLVLRDLNTVKDERPADLRALPYDAPEAIRRWKGFADAVLDAMPKTKLSWIAVGNEVDGVLKPERVPEYGRFLRAAFAHLRAKRPGVRLGTCIMFDGIAKRPETFRPLLEHADVAMANYYLIDAARRPAKDQVPKDLSTMQEFAGEKPLLLTETGAPSGSACGSSEGAQREFYATLLSQASDRQIPYVAFNWMNDIGDSAAKGFGTYYGSQDASFVEYLATLGLRRADGTPKPAWTVLSSRKR